MIIQRDLFSYENPREKGKCLTGDDTDLAFLSIPKNSSTWTKSFFEKGWNWQQKDITEVGKKKFIVVLRDPIERWISGITWYSYLFRINLSNNNTELKDLIFKKVMFDVHTVPQVNFLHGIDTDDCIFFMMDKNYENNIKKFVQPYLGRVYPMKLSYNSSEKSKTKDTFIDWLNEDPKYIAKLKKFYYKDYQLINSVKFYESN